MTDEHMVDHFHRLKLRLERIDTRLDASKTRWPISGSRYRLGWSVSPARPTPGSSPACMVGLVLLLALLSVLASPGRFLPTSIADERLPQ
jgi:hypothetical protein